LGQKSQPGFAAVQRWRLPKGLAKFIRFTGVSKLLRNWPILVAGFYFLGGVAAWAQFASSNGDGFGNLGLISYVMPLSLVGFGIGKITGAKDFVLIPSGLDPHTANALYFFPSLVLLTYLVGWKFPAIYRQLMDE
jgi:hypothetical protein